MGAGTGLGLVAEQATFSCQGGCRQSRVQTQIAAERWETGGKRHETAEDEWQQFVRVRGEESSHLVLGDGANVLGTRAHAHAPAFADRNAQALRIGGTIVAGH